MANNENNDYNNNRVPGAAEGVEKDAFQQSTSTLSGTGEKEALNIDVAGNTYIYIYIYSDKAYVRVRKHARVRRHT